MATPTTNRSRSPGTSLNAVTADDDGGGVNVSGYQTLAMQVVLTGSPTGGTVTLELSLDGTNWDATSTVFTIGTDTSGDIKFSTDTPAEFARAKLASLAGGTSPTVTALITGA